MGLLSSSSSCHRQCHYLCHCHLSSFLSFWHLSTSLDIVIWPIIFWYKHYDVRLFITLCLIISLKKRVFNLIFNNRLCLKQQISSIVSLRMNSPRHPASQAKNTNPKNPSNTMLFALALALCHKLPKIDHSRTANHEKHGKMTMFSHRK